MFNLMITFQHFWPPEGAEVIFKINSKFSSSLQIVFYFISISSTCTISPLKGRGRDTESKHELHWNLHTYTHKNVSNISILYLVVYIETDSNERRQSWEKSDSVREVRAHLVTSRVFTEWFFRNL